MSLLEQMMIHHGFSDQIQSQIQKQIALAGFENTRELILMAKGFVDRPEIFSEVLQSDFHFNALMAHRVRAVVMDAIQLEESSSLSDQSHISAIGNSLDESNHGQNLRGTTVVAKIGTPFDTASIEEISTATTNVANIFDHEITEPKKLLFKQVVVNKKRNNEG